MCVGGCPKTLPAGWPQIAESIGVGFGGNAAHKQTSLLKNSFSDAILFAVTSPCCANQRGRRHAEDDGEQQRTESLFYYFRLEDQIPKDHLLRLIDQHIDFTFCAGAAEELL